MFEQKSSSVIFMKKKKISFKKNLIIVLFQFTLLHFKCYILTQQVPSKEEEINPVRILSIIRCSVTCFQSANSLILQTQTLQDFSGSQEESVCHFIGFTDGQFFFGLHFIELVSHIRLTQMLTYIYTFVAFETVYRPGWWKVCHAYAAITGTSKHICAVQSIELQNDAITISSFCMIKNYVSLLFKLHFQCFFHVLKCYAKQCFLAVRIRLTEESTQLTVVINNVNSRQAETFLVGRILA